MQKSLFKKFFFTFMAIVLCAMIILGATILTFAGNFWIRDKQSSLITEAQAVANQIAAADGSINYSAQIMSIVCSATGGTMFISDTSGTILISSGHYLNMTGVDVPENIISMAVNENVAMISDLGGLLSEKCIIVSVPVMSEGKPIAVVFNVTPNGGLSMFLRDILKIFILSALAVIALLLLAAYYMAEKLVRPIKEMAEAARCMSRGDFSKYIRVDREDEIGELAVAFNNMTKSLAAGEQLRRGFIANVSHELKTPMTTISGFVDGILDGTISGDERSKYLEIVSAEVKRLSRLVVSMLNLSKLEAGEVKLRPAKIDLSQSLVNVAVGLEQQISRKNIEVVGMDELQPANVTADPDLMYQVVYNLVDNAIKYTPEDGTISVRSLTENGKVSIFIRNTGPGIPEKDLPYIFDRFYKVDKSRGTDKKGTGLGLYLVKTILNLHAGQITVRSIEGEYSEFIVTLDEAHESKKETNSSKEILNNG